MRMSLRRAFATAALAPARCSHWKLSKLSRAEAHSSCDLVGPRRGCSVWAAQSSAALELKRLLQPESRRRCLWILSDPVAEDTEDSVVEFVRHAVPPSSASSTAILDLGGGPGCANFEVLLERLRTSLRCAAAEAASLALSTTGGSSGTTNHEVVSLQVLVLAREPRLTQDLISFAEALAASDSPSNLGDAATTVLSETRDPQLVWARLALALREGDNSSLDDLVDASLGVLEAAASHAEQVESPPGYIDRPTGQRLVPYLLSFLEVFAMAAQKPALLALLRLEELIRSPFVDARGEQLLALLLQRLHPPAVDDYSGALRVLLHCCDGHTAFLALSSKFSAAVAALPEDREDMDASPLGVLVLQTEAEECSESPEEAARFEWQMDQVLSHPAVLNLRQAHAEGSTSFALVLWESIRHIVKRPHLAVPRCAEELKHPIVQALLQANLLQPRWAPSRLVFSRTATRTKLLDWINAQHAKLTWPQRIEYNVQIIRDKSEVTRSLDKLA